MLFLSHALRLRRSRRRELCPLGVPRLLLLLVLLLLLTRASSLLPGFSLLPLEGSGSFVEPTIWFCVNRKCSLERLLTKGQIWRPERWKYRPATVNFRQSFACGAQVSPAARDLTPFGHALARGHLGWRGGWRRRDGQLRWRCARLYLCIRAAVVAAGTAGTGHSGCAEREAGVTANAGTD